jgi:hypothetical protein
MKEGRGTTNMSELGQALKIIFEKLATFFDIFDLSFFISGALALGAIVFWLRSIGIPGDAKPIRDYLQRPARKVIGDFTSTRNEYTGY